MKNNYTLIFGDTIEEMKKLPDKSINMILCDLPYGKTQNRWDVVIPFVPLWEQYTRIIKERSPIVLFGQGGFSAKLILSNEAWYRYTIIWEKTQPTGFLNANRMPLRSHEDMIVFYKNLPKYNPQKTTGHPPVHSYTKHTSDGSNYGKTKIGISGGGSTERHPTSVWGFPEDIDRIWTFKKDIQKSSLHPTQKPVALLEKLVLTYSDKGGIILDNTSGSFSTGVACQNTDRGFIGIEDDIKYFELGKKRMEENEVTLKI